MSHFSAMAAKYTNAQQIVDTLKAMGVPEDEIYALSSLSVSGCKSMTKPHVARSSQWTGTQARGCDIYVTENGMKAMAQAAGAEGCVDSSMGLNGTPRQRCELGFSDCGCEENPGYVMNADPYESGSAFPGYFTAMYQAVGLRGTDMEHSTIHQNEDGSFRLVLRKRQENKGRGSRIASRARQLVSGRRR